MDGHTSATRYGLVRRIVSDGCVVDASLLHIAWCFLRIVAKEFTQHYKQTMPLLHHMYVYNIGFSNNISGQHFIGLLLGFESVAGAVPAYFFEFFLSVGPSSFVSTC